MTRGLDPSTGYSINMIKQISPTSKTSLKSLQIYMPLHCKESKEDSQAKAKLDPSFSGVPPETNHWFWNETVYQKLCF